MVQTRIPPSSRAGRWEKQSGTEPVYCFIPALLPPVPEIQYDNEMQDLEERANRALGRLDAVTAFLPSPKQFLDTYVRKEAVLSSQIEGKKTCH